MLRARLVVAALGAGAVFACAEGPALAATAAPSGTEVAYVAGPGEANAVTASLSDQVFTIRDTGATISASGGCFSRGPSEVECSTFFTPQRLTVELLDGDDAFNTTVPLQNSVRGGDGADQLGGGPGHDSLDGQAGEDVLWGGPGNDVLIGGSGSDTLVGEAGSDRISADQGGDRIEARDGSVDDVGCGEGIDAVGADPIDRVASDCESVFRGAAGTTAPPQAPVPPPGPPPGPIPAPEREVCAGAGASATAPPRTLAAATLCVVNLERRKRGLDALRRNARLELAAVRHARDMVRRSYFAHISPDGRKLADRLRRAGYVRGERTWEAGEALAIGIAQRGSPREVVTAWLQSRRHRAVMLSPRFREAGIGVAPGSALGPGAGAATYAADFGRLGRTRARR